MIRSTGPGMAGVGVEIGRTVPDCRAAAVFGIFTGTMYSLAYAIDEGIFVMAPASFGSQLQKSD